MFEQENVELEEVQPTGDDTAAADVSVSEDSTESEAPTDEVTGFESAFARARQKITAPSEDEAEPETPAEPEPEDEEESDESGDEKAETEDSEAKSDGEDKTSKRGLNYKEAVAEKERLAEENQRLQETQSKLDAQLKKFGGVEAVSNAMEIYERLASGNAMEVINELPAHVRESVQQQVFDSAIAVEANRVYGINHVLKNDFGLKTDLDQPKMEKLFEFLAYQLNEDAEDFEEYVDRTLEYASTPEREAARLKAELERLKNGEAEPEKTDKAETPDSVQEIALKIEKQYLDHENASFERLAQTELQKFGLQVTSKDTPAIRDAKTDLQKAVRSLVGEQMRVSKAFEPLFPFWAANDTDNPWYNQAATAYDRAMQKQIQTTLKSISRLFNAKPESPDKQIQIPDGKSAGLPVPQKTKPASSGGFESAFKQARANAGVD